MPGLTPVDIGAETVLETLDKVHAALRLQKGLELGHSPETSAYSEESMFGHLQVYLLSCKERHECIED